MFLGSAGIGAGIRAQDLRVTGILRPDDSSVVIQHDARSTAYYLLLRGPALPAIQQPVDVRLGVDGPASLQDPAAPVESGFYRIREIPLNRPRDTDGDGIDDLYELQLPDDLDPLDPGDAGLDPDGNGLSFLEEYRQDQGGFTRISRSSPAAGESGVAVTRETVLVFDRPLAAGTVLANGGFFASFGDRRILSRIELSTDRTTATLFYLENLPAGARIRVTFDGFGVRDARGWEVDGDGDGLPGGVGRFDFDTLSVTPVGATAVVGHVFASDPVSDGQGGFVNRPLENAIITVDGAEETLRTVTDADGFFRLEPAPAGRFFVHVDGRTALGSDWPDGAYYPFVGKAWEAVAGRSDNPAGGTGEVFLPRVVAGTLQPVSAAQETTITFPAETLAANPALAGVEVRVPANSLFSDDGTRGGRVGIAPVAPDRLPEPLPEGLRFPLVITIQTDGPRNFDQPVPVRFPNLPDPDTGEVLPPGAHTALWSFDHDKGFWEVVGSMTVSPDGRFVETDPGVGVLQPGWHGTRRGTSGGSPPPDGCGGQNFNYTACRYGGALKPAGEYIKNAAKVLSNPAGPTNKDALKLLTGLKGMTEAASARNQYCLGCCYASFGFEVCGAYDGLPRPFGFGRRSVGLAGYAPPAELDQAELELGAILEVAERHRQLLEELLSILGAAASPDELAPAERALYFAKETEIADLFRPQTQAAFYTAAVALAQNALAEVASLPAVPPTQSQARYLLTDLSTGVVRRGMTGIGGALDGLILAPDRVYQLELYFPAEGDYAFTTFVSGANGRQFAIPTPVRQAVPSLDTDLDGLADVAEVIVGTRVDRADTDGDLVADGAELLNGSDPLDGTPAEIGIIAAAAVGAPVLDVCADGDRAYVALGDAGVAVVEVPLGGNPTVIARVDTPGRALSVACGGTHLAVADEAGGLAVVDISDPPAARLVHQLLGLASATVVATDSDTAFVGTKDGRLVAVRLESGTPMGELGLTQAILDVVLYRDLVLVATANSLFVVRQREDGLELLGSRRLGSIAEGLTDRRRLGVAGNLAYVTSYPGYAVVDLADPAAPALVGDAVEHGPNSFKQILPTGSGLGVAAVGINPRDDGTHDIWLYDVRDPENRTEFVTEFPTPGITRSLALHRGQVLAADGDGGLLVFNYLAADTGGAPPTVRLEATFPLDPPRAESGTYAALIAEAADDVLVREVEFHMDGNRVAIDVGYPFEYRFRVPTLTAEKSTFTVRVRAIDTGGNATWSDPAVIAIVPDATPPRVRPAAPTASGYGVSLESVEVLLSEPVDAASLAGGTFVLREIGPDRVPGTADDVPVNGSIDYADGARSAALRFANPLPGGRYVATVRTNLVDLAGNPLANDVRWQFEVVSGVDSDGDGLTDEFEIANQLDPTSPDENHNGIPDALEDFDGEGVTNGEEMLLGTNPRLARTFDNVLDRDLDRDGDWLTDLRELGLGTDWTRRDTDGDGWNDEIEVTTGDSPIFRNAFLKGVRLAGGGGLLRLQGPQFRAAEGDVLRMGVGQASPVSAPGHVLRLAGPNENGHSIVAAVPPVRVRRFEVQAGDLTPYELPREGAFVIEAEDFNHGGGEHLPLASVMPYAGGAYRNLVAVEGVDYLNGDAVESPPYRPLPGPANIDLAENLLALHARQRPGWNVAENFLVGSPAAGDWLQFTRLIPAGDYWVWAALSSRSAGVGQLQGTLERVTGEPGAVNPPRGLLGAFDAPGSGATGANALVLLRDPAGEPVTVTVDQPATTLRYNLSRGDLDWLVLIPVTAAP
ncbi:MAG: Ig-like domain-containing protein [Verrucomicrobiales bacterium]|nr:Ig-like domain-containing protein [Verrucomicrobiales bacterium]